MNLPAWRNENTTGPSEKVLEFCRLLLRVVTLEKKHSDEWHVAALHAIPLLLRE